MGANGSKGPSSKRKARWRPTIASRRQIQRSLSKELQINIPVDQRLGDLVIEVDGLSKGFGEKLLIEDLSFSLPKAGIVGMLGLMGLANLRCSI